MNPSRTDAIQINYGSQISRAAQDFGDHEGMGTPKITRWIAQFHDGDIPLAVKILEEIKYYSIENIRAMVHNLVGLVHQYFREISQSKIFFIPIGETYEGSSVIARALREEINETRIKHMSDLERLDPEAYDALVFVEDFSGTGETLEKWWDNVEPLVRPREVPFAIALLVLNFCAREVIEQFASVVCVNELNESHNVVSPSSRLFTEAEKQRLVHYCRLTGCRDKYLLGYGKCGLLLAFKHQCPNNSLPILWHTCRRPEYEWEGLFKRSGL